MKKLSILTLIAGLFMFSVIRVFASPNQVILDKDIKVLAFDEMKYPPLARAARIQGIVVVRVSLDDAGSVKDAEAVSGAELLVRECLTNAKKWKFRPTPQKTAVIIYQFKMPGGECKSVSGLFMFRGPNFATIIGCDVPVETAP